jgi:hypothetical protein
MVERMRFVIRLKDGENMASLCREFGISRKAVIRSSSLGLERSRRQRSLGQQPPQPGGRAVRRRGLASFI